MKFGNFVLRNNTNMNTITDIPLPKHSIFHIITMIAAAKNDMVQWLVPNITSDS